MRLRITRDGTQAEVWNLTNRVVWSGSKSKASRSVAFGLFAREGQPVVDCPLGAQIDLLDNNNQLLFLGTVVSRSASESGGTVEITAYDRGLYLSNNDGTYQFRSTAPETAVGQLCRDQGIPVGRLAATGVLIDRKFTGVPLWKIVTTLYTKAAEQNGKRYMARFEGGSLSVLERTESSASLVIRGRSNLRGARTVESIAEMRNSVAIYDSRGTLLQVISDEASRQMYGQMQQHLVQRDGEDAQKEAQAILQDNGVSQSVSVDCSGDVRAITGETVMVEDNAAGLAGLFWIDGDTHTWQNGDYVVRLTLNCRNVMYTSNSGSEVTS